jgi:uroporphyrinogen-III synthase
VPPVAAPGADAAGHDQRDTVLVTRPEPGAGETAALLEASGFRAVLAPAMRIRRLPARLPDPAGVDALIVTSGQALPAIAATFHATTLLAVGDATAARARQAGFATVISASGDAADLVAAAARACRPRATLLLVTGRGHGAAVVTALRRLGFTVRRRSVYAPEAVRRLPAAAAAALRAGRVRAALFFSADTATRFGALLECHALRGSVGNTDAVAISPAAGVALEEMPWRRILVAARPSQDAMLALLR